MELFDASTVAGAGAGGAASFLTALTGIHDVLKEQLGALDDITVGLDLMAETLDDLEAHAKAIAGAMASGGRGVPLSGAIGAVPGKPPVAKPLIPAGQPFKIPVAAPLLHAGPAKGAVPEAATGGGFAGMLGGAASGIGRAASSVGSALSSIGSAAAAAIGPMLAIGAVATAAVGALAGFVLVAKSFAGLVSPAVVEAFDMAMRDLGAVVGIVLVPVVQEATRFLRGFAAALYPVVDAALPAMQSIARSVTDVLLAFMPVVSSLTSVVSTLLPLYAEYVGLIATFLLPQIRAFTTVITGWAAALNAVLKSIGGVFGGELKNAVMNLGQMMGRLTVTASALLFKFLGMTAALDAMIGDLKGAGKGLAGQRDATGLAAAQNARMLGVSDLGKEVMQRAFVETGRVGNQNKEVDDAEFRKILLGDLEKVRDFDLSAAIAKGIRQAALNTIPSPQEVLKGLDKGAGKVIGLGLLTELLLDQIL